MIYVCRSCGENFYSEKKIVVSPVCNKCYDEGMGGSYDKQEVFDKMLEAIKILNEGIKQLKGE